MTPLCTHCFELALDRLPLGHRGVDRLLELALLLLELAYVRGGRLVEETGIAEHLVDFADAGLGLLDAGGDLVATLLQLVAPAPELFLVFGPDARVLALLLAVVTGAQDRLLGVQVVVATALDVLFIRTAVVLDSVRGDFEDAIGQLAGEPAIVGDEDQGAVEGAQRPRRGPRWLRDRGGWWARRATCTLGAVMPVPGEDQTRRLTALKGSRPSSRPRPTRRALQAQLAAHEAHACSPGAEVPEPGLDRLSDRRLKTSALWSWAK